MKLEIAKKWVKALRSNKYEQAIGALRLTFGEKDEFCCLGVLCEVYKQDVGGEWDGPGFHFKDQVGDGVLPTFVADWAGVDQNPRLKVTKSFMKENDVLFPTEAASILNDDYGLSFKAIANAVERTYLGEKE